MLDRIAVTGATGQLGAELCRQLGPRAVPLDRGRCDLDRPESLARCLRAASPRAVINSAAYTQVDQAERDPEKCWRVNCHAVQAIAQVCAQKGWPLVQISTDYVFAGCGPGTPFGEEAPIVPLGVYATSKALGEQFARLAPAHLVARTCGLYSACPAGPVKGRNFVDTMLCLGKERPELRIVGDQTCTPSYVPHVARAVLQLLDGGQVGTWNVVNAGQTTWFEFAAEIFRLAGYGPELERITTTDYNAPAPRPAYSVLDCEKFFRHFGHKLPTWQEGLAAYFGR